LAQKPTSGRTTFQGAGHNFDWEKHADRFPMLNKPDPSYHGAVWTQAVKPLGPIAYIRRAA
jgi:O-acetylhomoserine (thiol)-lyase